MVSDMLRKMRTEKGLTQKQLAEKSGVSESAIKQYEGDRRQPRIEQLQMLASALGVSIKDLLPADVVELAESDLEDRKDIIKNDSDLRELEQRVYENAIVESFSWRYDYSVLASDRDFELNAREISDARFRQMLLESYALLNRRGRIEAVLRLDELVQNERFHDKPTPKKED